MRAPVLRFAAVAGWAGLFTALLATSVPPRVQATEAAVTYSRQIAPILYANCAVCHHLGGSGPFSLTSYAEAKRWGSLLKQVTATRYMPPWLPAPGHGEFADARRLSEEQIALIGRWVDAGMPEGDVGEAPPPPRFSTGWQLGPPDLVLEVDSPTTVPASGTDLFRNLILPVPIDRTRWVRAMEIKPGSPRVVHHANLLIDRTASLRRQHPQDWKFGIAGMDINVDAGEQFDPDSHFLNWKPDSTALVEAPETPWRIDPGNDLVLNEHLKPTGKVESVRTRIGLYFTDKPATRFPMLLQLEHDAALDIPAGEPRFAVEDRMTLPEDVDVLAVYPHAHYLGKRLEGWATLPGGERRDLILIPSWDIDRQSIYRFARPVALPAGSVVHMRYEYDNSAGNPHNPHTPPVRVTAGNRSEDEMGHLWLQVLPRALPTAATDPRAPLMRAWMENRLTKVPNDPEALFNLASLDLSGGEAVKAVMLYRRALEAGPKDVRVLTALGSALYKAGEWQEARARFEAAVALDGSYADARMDLAILDLQHDRAAEAEAQFRALLAGSPKDAAALNGLGSALLAQGRAGEAQGLFEQVIVQDPENFDANYNLATIMASSGHLEGALAYLRRASAVRPGDVDAYRGLVALYNQTDRLSEALEQQQAVVSLVPNEPDEWNNLGMLNLKAGKQAAAREAFEHTLRLDPVNVVAKARLARIGDGPR